MSRVVPSPVDEFPGSVTLADPMTFSQVIAYEEAIDAAREYFVDNTGGRGRQSRVDRFYLDGIFQSVEEWNLENFPETVSVETFPATPREAVASLISWLIKAVGEVYRGAKLEEKKTSDD